MKKEKKKFNFKVSNYPVGDFLIRIKNANLSGEKTVQFLPYKFVVSVAKCLMKEKYLREVDISEGMLRVSLNYHKKESVLTDIKLISKPGLRIYMKIEDIQKKKGPSIYILSTPGGIISSKEAVKKKIGGEVIAEIL